MADLKLTAAQEREIARQEIQQNFVFTLDHGKASPFALIGVARPTARALGVQFDEAHKGEINGESQIENRLKTLGLPVENKSQVEETKSQYFGLSSRTESHEKTVGGIRVVSPFVRTGFIHSRGGEPDKSLGYHEHVIAVPKENLRDFVEKSGVDFPGKAVVFPDLAQGAKRDFAVDPTKVGDFLSLPPKQAKPVGNPR